MVDSFIVASKFELRFPNDFAQIAELEIHYNEEYSNAELEIHYLEENSNEPGES